MSFTFPHVSSPQKVNFRTSLSLPGTKLVTYGLLLFSKWDDQNPAESMPFVIFCIQQNTSTVCLMAGAQNQKQNASFAPPTPPYTYKSSFVFRVARRNCHSRLRLRGTVRALKF